MSECGHTHDSEYVWGNEVTPKAFREELNAYVRKTGLSYAKVAKLMSDGAGNY